MSALNTSDDVVDAADSVDPGSASTAPSAGRVERLRGRVSLRLAAQVVWGVLVVWWLVSGSRMTVATMLYVGFVTGLLFATELRLMSFLRVLRDWVLVFAWFLGWAVSRSGVDALGMPIQEQIWIDIDRILGFGELPNHRLQRLIDWDGPAQLWEVTISAMYISHFLVGNAVLTILYFRDRLLWGRWMRRLVLLGAIGLFFFLVIPSAPPWMASDNGTVARIHEGLPRGWEAVEIEWINNLFEFGRDRANPVAAMPSLHAAFPALLYLFFAPRSGRLMRFILATYTLYMGFVIVISGQHWLIDVFAGWLVAWVAHVILVWFEARADDRRAAVSSPTDRGASPIAAPAA